MKKIFFVLFALCALTITSVAQTADSLNVNFPEISFNATEIDYGIVDQNSNGTRNFEFTNSGKQPLLLSNVSASCGCTVVEWAKEPIKPGEKGTLTVKYNTALIGTFSKQIRVFSNAKSSPVFLTIKGEVKPLQESKSQNHQ